MKKTIIAVFILLVSLQSCKENKKDTAVTKKEITDLSIYNLPSKWTTQNGNDIELKSLRGNVLVMVMIYTSCKAACPRLVADMRDIEAKLNKNTKKNVKLILVSIDPKTDTPERLKTFAIANKMNQETWLFLRSSEENTREFAAVLAVNYKQISPVDFSHSNIISVFNTEGELVFQQEGLGVNNEKTIETINKEAEKI
ncbi:SCO family protein [Flavobacterium sp. WLB]|uniref:SCO family protein n=1 Tax=unclassified Flavobacterium TaxID=196869 RepID=UPI0006ABA8F9|nr:MULTISPECIES: SCO family protein [unclassified Flavobacterium]KOP36690.1 electron transporter SenC [Flavobacterium sp. VMW]OWU91887.1 electron transporter SenC [Flavobacterium sp. NLM]PUU70075.1 SCO family protein [Flavobacterium sp. WLB]